MTDLENEAAGRAMVKAALKALGKFPDQPDLEDINETARRVVRALAAAGKAEKAEIKKARIKKRTDIIPATRPADAVATAFWLWSEQIPLDPSEVAPASVAGSRYLAFAQGMAAAKAMADALDMIEMDCELSFSSYGAERLISQKKT